MIYLIIDIYFDAKIVIHSGRLVSGFVSGACLVSVWVRVGSCLVHVWFLSGACPLRVWFVTGFVSVFAFVFVSSGSCPVRVWFVSVFVSSSCLVRVWFVFGRVWFVFGLGLCSCLGSWLDHV